MQIDAVSRCECVAPDYKRSGTGRRGRQRWRCKSCGRTTYARTGPEQLFAFSRLNKETDNEIARMLMAGHSIRDIQRKTGVTKHSVVTRRAVLFQRQLHEPKALGSKIACNYCGKKISGDRRFKRRATHLKHMFCTGDCYQNFRAVSDVGRLANYLENQTRNGVYSNG